MKSNMKEMKVGLTRNDCDVTLADKYAVAPVVCNIKIVRPAFTCMCGRISIVSRARVWYRMCNRYVVA